MFQPEAGDEIHISGITFRVAPHPSAPNHPYGQEGRQAVVYKLESQDGYWALKAFKHSYRRPFLVRIAREMSRYASLPGMEVCERRVIQATNDLDLLRKYPDLTYAALMPWVEGPTWMETLLARKPLSAGESLSLAHSLLRALVSLEEEGLSHGDLSSANILLPARAGGVEVVLVDMEQLYIPGMERPEVVPSGSPGYAEPWATEPTWGVLEDRFSGALLLTEMLAFCDERAVKSSYGESFFSEGEPGKDTDRARLAADVLQKRWGGGVSALFNSFWKASSPEECPPFVEWLIALPDAAQPAKAREPVAPPRPIDAPTGLDDTAPAQTQTRGPVPGLSHASPVADTQTAPSGVKAGVSGDALAPKPNSFAGPTCDTVQVGDKSYLKNQDAHPRPNVESSAALEMAIVDKRQPNAGAKKAAVRKKAAPTAGKAGADKRAGPDSRGVLALVLAVIFALIAILLGVNQLTSTMPYRTVTIAIILVLAVVFAVLVGVVLNIRRK